MFSVLIFKSIWTHEESEVKSAFSERSLVLGRSGEVPKVAFLHREVLLPFAPYLGLNVNVSGWNSGLLRSVSWLSEEQKFHCSVDDEYPRWALDTLLSFDDLLCMGLESGWVRAERGGGDAPRLKGET